MNKLKQGTPVWFRGEGYDTVKGRKMLSVGGDNAGNEWFLALVDHELMVDDLYTLRWADGTAVGLPFRRDELLVAAPSLGPGWKFTYGTHARRHDGT